MFAAANRHPNFIAGCNAVRPLPAHEIALRKAVLVGSRPLVLPASRAEDVQNLHAGIELDAVDPADAECVKPVFLRHAEGMPVELGQCA